MVANEMAQSMLQSQREAMLKTVFTAAHLKQVDKWIAGQPDPAIDRSEAIRRLVELGLKAKEK
jgi:L-2-hydroxyglutarate oxidase LhgO